MMSGGGRKSRGPGVSSLNGARIPTLANSNSSVGAGYKGAAAAYGGQAAKPILGAGPVGTLSSGNVFNIPKYGSGGLGGGIGGGGDGLSSDATHVMLHSVMPVGQSTVFAAIW